VAANRRVRAHASAFPDVESCRGALQFPRNIVNPKTSEFFQELAAEHDIEAFQALPTMCVHGAEDRAIPVESAVLAFNNYWPDRPVVRLPGVGHFLQEDAPETVGALVEQFMQMC
jgi:haloalkane dehalogenase